MTQLIDSVGQIALPGSDPDRSQAFYGETLGLPFLYRFGALVFFSAGNLRLMLSGEARETVAPSGLPARCWSGAAESHAAVGKRGRTIPARARRRSRRLCGT